mmetsp:Transcript_8588/g.32149  ORF Transcript_8588/g.32149 Transcript_8588/m.32149 type:complete len:237 (+) Transcript_8588:2592-3302(+)
MSVGFSCLTSSRSGAHGSIRGIFVTETSPTPCSVSWNHESHPTTESRAPKCRVSSAVCVEERERILGVSGANPPSAGTSTSRAHRSTTPGPLCSISASQRGHNLVVLSQNNSSISRSNSAPAFPPTFGPHHTEPSGPTLLETATVVNGAHAVRSVLANDNAFSFRLNFRNASLGDSKHTEDSTTKSTFAHPSASIFSSDGPPGKCVSTSQRVSTSTAHTVRGGVHGVLLLSSSPCV